MTDREAMVFLDRDGMIHVGRILRLQVEVNVEDGRLPATRRSGGGGFNQSGSPGHFGEAAGGLTGDGTPAERRGAS
jgi:hypothetical protein